MKARSISMMAAQFLAVSITSPVLGALGPGVEGGGSAPDISSGLVAWWDMAGRAQQPGGPMIIPDASGNGHDLTVQGAPSFLNDVPVRGGISHDAVLFWDDGVLWTDDSDALDLVGDWTISFWVREDSNNHFPTQGETNPTNGWVEKVRAYHDSEGGWAVVSEPGDKGVAVATYAPNAAFFVHEVLPQGEWTRLTTTYKSETGFLKVYFDSELRLNSDEDDQGRRITMVPNTYRVVLGGNEESNGVLRPYALGALADVRIYDRVLSPNDIRQMVPEPSALTIMCLPVMGLLRRRVSRRR